MPKVEDLILVSVDDHVVEPPDLFDGHLPDKWKEYAPKLVRKRRRHRRLELRGRRDPEHRAQRGGRPAARGVRDGADVVRRDAHGLLRHPRPRQGHERERRARLDVLPELPAVLRAAVRAPRKGPRAAAACSCRRTTTGTSTSGAARTPGASSRSSLPPIWDPDSSWPTRCAASPQGLPRDDVLREPGEARVPEHPLATTGTRSSRRARRTSTVICLHIGSSSTMVITAPSAPMDVLITLSPINIVQAAADLVWSQVLQQVPEAPVRAVRGRHRLDSLLPASASTTRTSSTASGPARTSATSCPSQVVRRARHRLLHRRPGRASRCATSIGIDMITWECDYPHSDSTWPQSPETLVKQMRRRARRRDRQDHARERDAHLPLRPVRAPVEGAVHRRCPARRGARLARWPDLRSFTLPRPSGAGAATPARGPRRRGSAARAPRRDRAQRRARARARGCG